MKDIAQHREGAVILTESDFIRIICETPLFGEINNESFYSPNCERSLVHSFWCITLAILKEYLL